MEINLRERFGRLLPGRGSGSAPGLSFEQRFATGIAVLGVSILLAATLAGVLAVLNTERVAGLQTRALQVRVGAYGIETILAKAEAAERGWFLTGDDTYAAALDETARELDVAAAGLATVAGPQQRPDLEQIRSAVRTRISAGVRAIATARSGNRDEALAALRALAPGDSEAHAMIRRFTDANLAMLDRFGDRYRQSTRRLLLVLLSASLALVFFGLHQVGSMRRLLAEATRSRRELRIANTELESLVSERTEELAGTVARFELALRAASVVVFSQDDRRRFTFLSRPILGVEPADALGKTEEEIFPAHVAALAVPHSTAVLKTAISRDYEYGTQADGEDGRWFRVRAEPIKGPDGQVSGLIGAIIDVTAEAMAQGRLMAVTDELSAVVQRFDAALRGAEVFVFTQDRALRFTFASHGLLGIAPDRLLGKSDSDVLPPDISAPLTASKRRVMETGVPVVEDMHFPDSRGVVRPVRMRLEPLRDSLTIAGVIGCAVDVSREADAQKRLESVTDVLRTTVQRFEIALRSAEITVFAQDPDLRYTWASAALFGRAANTIGGLTDPDLLPAEAARRFEDLKREALASGELRSAELRSPAPEGDRWFAVSVQPQRNAAGIVDGLLGSALDVTDRRARETHNRILLRELTHRTKNLLAVVQAIGRQTLLTTSSAQDFEHRFSGRLQGLAMSLDILFDENWEGASIAELVRSQLSHYRDLVGWRIRFSGPDMRLEPEAAQNLGLALHELCTNAAKFGALSGDEGTVDVRWGLTESDDDPKFRITWTEQGGPAVQPAARKGFGHAVLERLVPRAVSGRGVLNMRPDGIEWVLEMPARFVHSLAEAGPPLKIWTG
ncbi:PAS domain-containing protein [uncultured Alsobacter sp.]|uniref:PAS domain-containing protein n=1 Tax=uncultured Alsobacter sp. TaxID=1748258 RepID=UPI0025DB7756|nr:PAS domain-containing protein [uncultured Alsobacter sp.]